MPIRKCRTFPDCLPRENVRQVCMAPTGWEEIRFPICWFSVSAQENTPREFAKENSLGAINTQELASAEKRALRPFERNGSENPYAVQHKLQDMMQDLVGIVRQEQEMRQALERHSRAEDCQRDRQCGREPGIQCRLAHRARPAQSC